MPTLGTSLSPALQERRLALVLRLTLLLVLLFGPVAWYSALPSRMLALFMLLGEERLSSRVCWALLAVVLLQGVAFDWYAVDNHQYLIAYWVLAVNLALHHPEPEPSLRFMAHGLIAGTFLFAATWKVVGGEFLDGRFFEGMFLIDPRLRVGSAVLGGLSPADWDSNYVALQKFWQADSPRDSVRLATGPHIEAIAAMWSWGGLALESAIGTLFVVPFRWSDERLRVTAVIAFIALVYVWLPVIGFAWVILTMTLAHLEPESRTLERVLVGAAIGLPAILAPPEYLFAWAL